LSEEQIQKIRNYFVSFLSVSRDNDGGAIFTMNSHSLKGVTNFQVFQLIPWTFSQLICCLFEKT